MVFEESFEKTFQERFKKSTSRTLQ